MSVIAQARDWLNVVVFQLTLSYVHAARLIWRACGNQRKHDAEYLKMRLKENDREDITP